MSKKIYIIFKAEHRICIQTDLSAERQADGIASAKKRGVKFGGTPKLTDTDVLKIIDFQNCTTMSNADIAKEFGIARSTLLRYVANYKKRLQDS